jgi:TonB-linked SusC/RagA family outer membrane protein
MKLKRLLLLMAIGLLTGFTAMAQTKVVTGKITDSTGNGLSGISVLVPGTKAGTQTGNDGTFKINVPAGATNLELRSVNYATQTVSIGSGTVFATLRSVSGSLNDVVVIGYGSTNRKNITSALAVVSAKDFQKGSITTPEQLIAGKVAGVSITSNGGAPGSGSTIRIRGGASLNASNDPLIVVDGIPLSNDPIGGGGDKTSSVLSPLSLINPDDIETFTVLKDASATAIYGSRGSNGVILITTKKGRSGKGVFNFNTTFSVSKIVKELPVMDASTYRTFVDTLAERHSEVVASQDTAYLGNSNTDWQKQIYQTAITSNNTLSYSGSTKNVPYRIGMDVLNQDGILKTDKLQRVTGTLSLNPRLFKDHLRIDMNLHGSVTNARFANQSAIGDALVYDPTQPVYAKTPFNGNPYAGWYQDLPNGSSTGGDTLNYNINAPKNPVEDLMRTVNTGSTYRGFGNIQADYKLHFLPDLHIVANWGFDFSQGRGTDFTYANTFNNLYGNNNPYLQNTNNETFQSYLNYVKDIKSINSSINATAGYEYQNFLSNYNGEYSYYAVVNPNNGNLKDTVANSKPAYPVYQQQHTIISYYGRLIYSFADKYIVTGSIREEGTSRFGPLNASIGDAPRWFAYPSISGAWRINKENFLKKSSVVSDLKLRVSYGITGQEEGLGNYGYLPTYTVGQSTVGYVFGNTPYLANTPQTYISNLTWEQTKSWNAGLDYGFFKNRISGSIDVYDRKTSNLYVQTNISAGANYTNYTNVNLGNMESKGIELLLNFVPVKNKNFTWEVGFNAAYDEHKITNLTFPGLQNSAGSPAGALPVFMSPTVQINTVGYTPFSYYLYKQIYSASGAPIEGLYADLNRDGSITSKDLSFYKSPTPKVILGFSTQASYKRWTLSTVLRANIGNYNYNVVEANLGIAGNALNKGFIDNVPTSYFNTNFLNNEFLSNYFVQNASFLRMDNLGLNYSVGKIMNDRVGLNLSANCQNVFIVTKYSGIDPEVYGGLDNNTYPRPRIYTLGVNLTF